MNEIRLTAIRTPRLRLETFGPQHAGEHYLAWLNDPVTMAYSEQRHRRHTAESAAAYRKSFQNSPDFFWAVVRLDDGSHVGNVSAAVDTHNSLANLSILIGRPEARRLGLGREAWVGACDFLMRRQGIRKIQAGTLEVNAPMLALARRVGMVEDGRRARHYLWQGREVDLVHFALFREVWLACFPDTCWPGLAAMERP